MLKRTLPLFAAGFAMLTSAAYSGTLHDVAIGFGNAESQYVSLCSSWTYESSVRGYVCQFQGPTIRIPEEREVEQLRYTVKELEQKLRELEDRVKRIEDQS